MKTVDDYEAIRRAYFVEGCSIRGIIRRLHHGSRVIRKALDQPQPERYRLTKSRPAPTLEPYKPKIQALLDESDQLPRKQRYTAHKIFLLLQAAGYPGSEGGVHNYVCQQRKLRKARQAYLPLEFAPGQDAQVDWGAALAEIGGKRMTVQVFILRLNYSRVRFVMAFPFQKQEAFFEGHLQAFRFLGGVPRRITYDNLKTAVFKLLEGHQRQEQEAFTAFRSYYLFESHYCTPAQGHEKGGGESDVGYTQRNFFAPIPKAASFLQLNADLAQLCRTDMQRHVRGKALSAEALWKAEQSQLLPLPPSDYPACTSHVVKVNPYSQVVFETNRYSVPTAQVGQQLVLRAYPFQVELLSLDRVVAVHPRSLEREQDILDPLHYLGLLAQRPGAFEHALPMRQWRQSWPVSYEQLLEDLRCRWPDGRGVREFVTILKLHQTYPAERVAQAIAQAVAMGCTHLDGVQLCLRQQLDTAANPASLDLSTHPEWAQIGSQAVDLEQYNQLLRGS
jgi:transposase